MARHDISFAFFRNGKFAIDASGRSIFDEKKFGVLQLWRMNL